jgi:hypothetical protein
MLGEKWRPGVEGEEAVRRCLGKLEGAESREAPMKLQRRLL